MNLSRLNTLSYGLTKYTDNRFRFSLGAWGIAKNQHDFSIHRGVCKICPAGFACLMPEFNLEGLGFRTVAQAGMGSLLLPTFNDMDGTEAILEFFELTMDEFNDLFMAKGYGSRTQYGKGEIEREAIIKKIEAYTVLNIPEVKEDWFTKAKLVLPDVEEQPEEIEETI